jgi:hypothetical protein
MSKILDSLKSALGMKGPAEPDPEDELAEQVTKFVTEKWVDLKSAYWMYHSWIWGALLMYAGELWIEYAPDRKLYQRVVPKDDFVPQPRLNKFAASIDAIASNFQQVPEVEAVPTPLDNIQNVGIAEVANELATYFIKDAALRSDYHSDDNKVGTAGQMLTLMGCFFTNVYVEDKEIGREKVMEEQPGFEMQCLQCDIFQGDLTEEPMACPQCGNTDILKNPKTIQAQAVDEETGEPKTRAITEKHVRLDIENPIYQYPRPGARDMKTKDWIMIAERNSLDEIWRKYGIEAQADSEYPDGWNTTNENALNFFYLGYSNYALSGKDAAMVIRVYCEPGKLKDYPDGFYGVYVNGKCQKATKWNYLEDPLTKCDYKAIPTLFFPRSVAFDLVGVQKEKSDFWSIFKLHALTTAVDPWLQDLDTMVTEITGRGDKVIKYRKISPDSEAPHHAQAGHLDEALYRLDDKIDQEFDNISQAVQAFRGEVPEGVKSGTGLESLSSQAEFMFSGPVANWNGCWKESVRKGVKCMQKSYTTAQLLEIVGPDKMTELQAFQQCDLDKCVEWIASKGGTPRTRQDRKNEMVTLFDRQALDLQDPEVKQKLFELFGETGMMSTFNKDATRARMENIAIKNGGDPMFMPEIEDLETHYGIHADQIKSPDFLKWKPEAQTKLIQHALMTKQAIQSQAQPPEKIQVQMLKNQGEQSSAQLDRDTKLAVAEISSKVGHDANAIGLFMQILDRTQRMLEQPPASPGGNPSPPPPPA